MANNFIIIENSTFIFDTNLSGDPKRDRFNSDQRKANLVIQDEEQAQRLLDDGFMVMTACYWMLTQYVPLMICGLSGLMPY